jgi:hypothetical protein
MAQICQNSGVHRLHARSPNAQSWVPVTTSVKELWPRRSASRRPHRSVKRGRVRMWRVQSCNNILHDIVHVLVTNSNSCFSIGRTYNVGTSLLQISEGFDAYCTTSTSRYVHVRTINLTSEMTRQASFPMQNVIPQARRAALLDCWRRLESPNTWHVSECEHA